MIYEGEPGQETLEGIVTDVSCIFMQVDPMAEKYYGMTSYGYCAGNPVMMVDNLGSQPQSIAYEVVKTFSKKGIQHYLFLSVAPLCAPLSAVLLAGGMVVGDTPITEFSEDDTEGKTTNQDGDDVSGDSTDTEVDFPSSSDEVNSTGGTKIPDSELTPPDKRGHAPKGKDGYPIELHHRGQSQDGPLDEMTRTQHRVSGILRRTILMLVQKSRKLTEMKAIENAESIGRNTGIMEGSGTEIQMEVPIDSFWSGYINPYHEDYEVWIEDNHSVAYAYLVQNGRIISDVWLYNHGVSPKTPEWDDPSKMPFKQAQCFMNEYADKIEPIESDNDFDLVWCDSGASVGVAIVIKGIPCALLTSDNVPSFSTCVNRDNPLALHIDVTELLSIINS